jgi:hypothetical protein
MDKTVILSGVFIGKCILFSSFTRAYYLNFDKDRRKPPLIVNIINTICMCRVFYQIVDMLEHMQKIIE